MQQLTAAQLLRECQSAYQSECGDHRLHERHWVNAHWWRQAVQTPPVSKVFHSCPQVQDQRSSLRGDQPHCGQRNTASMCRWLKGAIPSGAKARQPRY
jgi:hypothetical protein